MTMMKKRAGESREGFWDHDYFRHWVEDPGSEAISQWLVEEVALLHVVLAGFARPALLDVGCGYGRHVLAVAESCSHVLGIDSNPTLAAEARRLLAGTGLDNVQILIGDARAMEQQDGVFDVSICMTNTLGNIDSGKSKVLSEMRRVTRSGGPLS
jgi:ubiquinone/menaquinone biosynthesis C-methylase UbiE